MGLLITWSSQAANTSVNIEGAGMLFTNNYTTDADSIWQILQPGVQTLTTGTGPYQLKEQTECSVTRCAFEDDTTSQHFNGTMDATGGTLTSTKQMFFGMCNLTALDVSGLITANVTNMLSMFYNCKLLTTLDVSGFDTRGVTNMQMMFNECRGLGSITIKSTFGAYTGASTNNACRSITNVPGFNTALVTNTMAMFAGCASLTTLDLVDFNTASVTNMSSMFSDCSSLVSLDISRFDVSNVSIMTQMFSGCSSLTGLDLTSFDTNRVDAMTAMFFGCSNIRCISNLNTTGAIHGRGGIFNGCTALVRPDQAERTALMTPPSGVGGADWNNVGACPPPSDRLTITWQSQTDDVAVTIENACMYYSNDGGATQKTLSAGIHLLSTGFGPYSLIELDPGTVSRCAFTDAGCSSQLRGNAAAFGGALTSMREMFFECTGLVTLDVSNLNTGWVQDMSDAFSNVSGITQLNISGFDTTKVNDMSGTFNGCSQVAALDVSNFDTSLVRDMSSMFAGCKTLTTLDLSNFKTAQVADMSYMFWGCSGLIPTINVSSFDTNDLIATKQMFSQCCSVDYLDLSGFDTVDVLDMKGMFWHSNKLKCITDLDSRAANGSGKRSDIFTGCAELVAPDSADQSLIEAGTLWSNTGACPAIPLNAPSWITDLAASDDQHNQITFTWTLATGTPTPTYDLYDSTGLIATGVNPGYVRTVNGIDDYYLIAMNSEGTRQSNTASGTGVVIVLKITDLTATSNLEGRSRFNWTEQ